MPHKHKRRHGDADLSTKDLAPSVGVDSLPIGKKPASARPSKKRKRSGDLEDDTPKAFVRMMQFQKTGQRPTGLDDGEKPRKKKKHAHAAEATASNQDKKALRIMPGERMAEFSARVNQALPLAGINQKGKKIEGFRERRTKLEKKITKRQEEWRKNEEKRKEREEEARDLEEEEDEAPDYWGSKDGRRSKRQRRQGDTGAAVDDPWEKLKDAREKPKGVFDVVQEPPTFTRLPTEKFKVKQGARVDVVDVPNAAGSLRKREELGDTRKSLIESYRRMMESRRDQAIPT